MGIPRLILARFLDFSLVSSSSFCHLILRRVAASFLAALSSSRALEMFLNRSRASAWAFFMASLVMVF